MKIISDYWKHLNEKSIMLIDEYGYENFKQTVARVYNDDAKAENHFEATKMLWNHIYDIIPIELLDKFSEPDIGNPPVILRDEKLVSIDLGISIRDYWELAKHIDFGKINKIVEIGGGYGRMPYVITQIHPDIEYVMCDIEPSLGLAKWYLSQVIPDANMVYINPEELEGKSNLVIANNCFHEMTRKQVHDYFNYADQNSDYLYYNCWKETTMPRDFIKWTQGDYPVKNSWTKLFEQDYIRKNYFEVLYKCQV